MQAFLAVLSKIFFFLYTGICHYQHGVQFDDFRIISAFSGDLLPLITLIHDQQTSLVQFASQCEVVGMRVSKFETMDHRQEKMKCPPPGEKLRPWVLIHKWQKNRAGDWQDNGDRVCRLCLPAGLFFYPHVWSAAENSDQKYENMYTNN